MTSPKGSTPATSRSTFDSVGMNAVASTSAFIADSRRATPLAWQFPTMAMRTCRLTLMIVLGGERDVCRPLRRRMREHGLHRNRVENRELRQLVLERRAEDDVDVARRPLGTANLDAAVRRLRSRG